MYFYAFHFILFYLRFDGCSSLPLLNPLCRSLSSTEVSTALRPFYFFVHPDLFGQFPEERVYYLLNFIHFNSTRLKVSFIFYRIQLYFLF